MKTIEFVFEEVEGSKVYAVRYSPPWEKSGIFDVKFPRLVDKVFEELPTYNAGKDFVKFRVGGGFFKRQIKMIDRRVKKYAEEYGVGVAFYPPGSNI